MKQQLDAVRYEQSVRRAFERGHVVGLGEGLSQDQVRLVQAVQGAHSLEQVRGDAMHDLADVAEDVCVQAAKIGHPGCRSHATQEPIALGEQNACAIASRGTGCGHAGRPASEHDDIEFSKERDGTGRLCNASRMMRDGSHMNSPDQSSWTFCF
jgi:hypothetical protein